MPYFDLSHSEESAASTQRYHELWDVYREMSKLYIGDPDTLLPLYNETLKKSGDPAKSSRKMMKFQSKEEFEEFQRDLAKKYPRAISYHYRANLE